MKRPPHDGDEQDAFSRWRRVTRWQRGEIRAIKRRAAKRDRRIAREEIKEDEGLMHYYTLPGCDPPGDEEAAINDAFFKALAPDIPVLATVGFQTHLDEDGYLH